MNWVVPTSARLHERVWRSMISVGSRARVARSWLKAADLDVLGSYNTSNVGDVSFALCLEKFAQEFGASTSLQDYSRYEQYCHGNRAIVGGGGVLGPHHRGLSACAARVESANQQITFIGVSGSGNSDDISPSLQRALEAATFVSVRDRSTQTSLRSRLARGVELQPDIAFGLLKAFSNVLPAQTEATRPTLGINIAPVLASRRRGRFEPNEKPSNWFAERFPQLASVYPRIAPAYVELVRSAIHHYRQHGWEVLVVSFAAEDAAFARSALSDLSVSFARFDLSPVRVLRRVARCQRFLATRFHAHVFALLARVPLLTMPYSPKCNSLLMDLGKTDAGMNPAVWVEQPDICLDYLTDEASPVVLARDAWQDVQERAVAITRRGLASALRG